MKLLYIDLFCGAGGTSTGVESARLDGMQCAKVIACVNHDAKAIASHAANHPDALHFTEDIRTLQLSPLVAHAERMKMQYPDAKVVLWASLECTNFSKAKGGQPRDADSRTLAEHLFRYIEALNPDFIQIENVEEFMSWGDMDENGKPISRDKGKCYVRWCNRVRRYGYDFEHRILNAADYGAYTTRKRFFGIFAKRGLPIVFPAATHCKGGKADMFGSLEKWKPVRDVLDFSDLGNSIFRERALSENTLERIYAGLVRFVAGGQEAFLSKQYSGSPEGKNVSINGPAGTITCRDHHMFVSAYYGNGHNHSIEAPAPTLTTKDRLSVVTAFFGNEYSGGGQLSSLENPCPAVLTRPKQALISVRQHYLLNPQYRSFGRDIDDPCFTLIARMDKRPPCLITTEPGSLPDISMHSGDTPMTRKIKSFMQLYHIIDIYMRMLKTDELKRIMGFPEDYVLIGTQAEQKKYIGNAVEVNMSRALCEALCQRLAETKSLLKTA